MIASYKISKNIGQDVKFQNLGFQDLKFQNLGFQDLKFQNLRFQDLKFQNLGFQDPNIIFCQKIIIQNFCYLQNVQKHLPQLGRHTLA